MNHHPPHETRPGPVPPAQHGQERGPAQPLPPGEMLRRLTLFRHKAHTSDHLSASTQRIASFLECVPKGTEGGLLHAGARRAEDELQRHPARRERRGHGPQHLPERRSNRDDESGARGGA